MEQSCREMMSQGMLKMLTPWGIVSHGLLNSITSTDNRYLPQLEAISD